MKNEFKPQKELEPCQEREIVSTISAQFDRYDMARSAQLEDISAIRSAIYETACQNRKKTDLAIPDVWELAQTLKSHLIENLYSNPEGMFDVSGATIEAQASANAQKSMLVSYFEKMNFSNEIEKIVDSVVETGEATVLVGWETKTKTLRRPQTLEEQVFQPTEDGFTLEEKCVFDGPKVRFIPAQDFVFDPDRLNSFDSAPKIFRSWRSVAELRADKLLNLLDEQKTSLLKALVGAPAELTQTELDLCPNQPKKGVKGEQLELLEFWGDIEIGGTLYPNMLAVVAGRSQLVRLEQNPFITQPFVHASIITDPRTSRGISPLKVALGLSDIASTILNKQLDALSLIVNPPYLAPKGCFKGEQLVTPGKIIEYDAALMPNAPIPLSFSPAMQGWDFINYFKSSIESATGIFKTMAGNLAAKERSATEISFSAAGQSARLNMLIDSISRKILIPTVEKTADILANFKIGDEYIPVRLGEKLEFVRVCDLTRRHDYIYRYGDRRATIERKLRFKELFDIIAQFAQRPDFAQRLDMVECFKFALEQYGIENPSHFLAQSEF